MAWLHDLSREVNIKIYNVYFSWKVTQSRHKYYFSVEFLDGGKWKNTVYNSFFHENTSGKFLILLLLYLPIFWLQISSVFAIIFADYHGLSCVHVWASWYKALFQVSLRGVGLKCVGRALVCRSGSKDICTLQPGFLCSLLFICWHFYSLSCVITKVCIFLIPSTRSHRFGSRFWKGNIDQNWNLF